MKRFVWRLQRVLDIKRKEEQTKRLQLLGITEELAQKRGEVFMQKRVLKNIIDSLTEQTPQSRLSKQEFFLKSSTTTDEVIRQLETKINELGTRQKEKIAEILKLREFKEGLEKLRVEAKRQFITEQEKIEQKNADEMTTMSFARKIIQKNKIDKYIEQDIANGQLLNKETGL